MQSNPSEINIKDLILSDNKAEYYAYCEEQQLQDLYDFLKNYYLILNTIEQKKSSSKDSTFFKPALDTEITSALTTLFETYIQTNGAAEINLTYQYKGELRFLFKETSLNFDTILTSFADAAKDAEALLKRNTEWEKFTPTKTGPKTDLCEGCCVIL